MAQLVEMPAHVAVAGLVAVQLRSTTQVLTPIAGLCKPTAGQLERRFFLAAQAARVAFGR